MELKDNFKNLKNIKEKNKKKESGYKTEDYLIAYFDILGYKNIIIKNIISEDEFIDIIQKILKQLHKILKYEPWSKYSPKIFCFSDNFLICIKNNEAGYTNQFRKLAILISIMQALQCQLIALNKILIRGSIVRGNLYCNENFVFGEGLIKAYMLENNVAIYPRILIQKEIIDEVISKYFDMISKLGICNKSSKEITSYNVFNFYANTICDLFKKNGIINKETYEVWYDDCKHTKIVKDFDENYFIDYLEYLNRDESTQENIKKRYIRAIEFYLSKFSDDISVIKKILWICNYANEFFIKNGEKKIFDRDSILMHSYVDLEKINKILVTDYQHSSKTKLEKLHLEYLIKIVENI